MSNTELIAILLRTGMQGENVLAVASRLLAHFDGLAGLGRTTFAELCAQRGLSEAKACQLLAALELGRRFVSLAPEERMVTNSPQDAANLVLAEMAVLDQEHLRVLLLNATVIYHLLPDFLLRLPSVRCGVRHDEAGPTRVI